MTDHPLQSSPAQEAEVLSLFAKTLQLSTHILQNSPAQLTGQFVGRLLGSQLDEVQALIQAGIARKESPWLRMLSPTLTPPGGPLVRILSGHTDTVSGVALTPNGACAVSCGWDRNLIVWNLESGEALHTLSGHTDDIHAVAVSPDSRFIFSGSSDQTIKVWDLQSGKLLHSLDAGGTVTAIAAIPGRGQFVAAQDNVLKVLDVEKAEALRSLEGHTDEVWAAAVTPSGKQVVSASKDTMLKVWDLDTGKALRTLQGHTDMVSAVALSPDGSRIISGSKDGDVIIWNLNSGEALRTLSGHNDVRAVAVTPDGRRIISGAWDKTVKVWDLETGEELGAFEGHAYPVFAVAVTPDGRHVVSAGSDDQTLRIWDLHSLGMAQPPAGHTGKVSGLAVTPDGERLVSCAHDYTLKVWDVKRQAALHSLKGHSSIVLSATILPDGKRVISNAMDSTLKVWDVESGEELHSLGGHADQISDVALTPDGSRAISASANTLRIWNLENGKLLRTLNGYDSVLMTPDGRRAVSRAGDKAMILWDLQSSEAIRTLAEEVRGVSPRTFTPDGRRLFCTSWQEIRVWDVENGQELPALSGHTSNVSAVKVTGDGATAISCSGSFYGDPAVRVWKLKTGEQMQTLEGHTSNVYALGVTPDGRYSVSCADDQTLRVWDLETGEQITFNYFDSPITACAIAPDGRTLFAGDNAGQVHFLRLDNVPPLGPVFVTAVDKGAGDTLRCPICLHTFPLQASWLGAVIDCPNKKCAAQLKVNPFVIREQPGELTFPPLPAEPAVKAASLGSFVMANDGLLVGGYADGSLRVWTLGAETPTIIETGGQKAVTALAVTPDGAYAVSGAADGRVDLWNLAGEDRLASCECKSEISALAVTLDRRVAIGCADGSLKFWDTAGDPFSLDGHDERVTAVAFLHTGQIVSGSKDLRVRFWEPQTRGFSQSFKGHLAPITAISAAADGNQVIWGCGDGRMFIWTFGSTDAPAVLSGNPSPVLATAIGSRPLILSGGEDGIIRVIDLEAKKIPFRHEYGAPIIAGALTPDGKRGAIGDRNGDFHRFRFESGS